MRETDSEIPFWKKKRYMIVFLAFLGFYNVFAMRMNLSVAIVAMTEPKNGTYEYVSIHKNEPEFDWNSKEQGLILSSYFYGYVCSQILGGIMASRYGGHTVSIIKEVDRGIHLIVLGFWNRNYHHSCFYGLDATSSTCGSWMAGSRSHHQGLL